MTEEPRVQAISLRKRFLSPQTAISFGALAVLLAVLITLFDIEWSTTWELMRGMNPLWYGAAVLVHYTTFYFRGARWRILLANAARRDGQAFEPRHPLYYGRIILISWFANSTIGFRSGDAYRAYAYAEDTNASFPRTAGTVLADRLIDLSVVGTLMVLGILVLLIGGQIDPPVVLVAVAVGLLGVIAAGLVGMTLARRWVVPLLPRRSAGIYDRFHEGTMGSFGKLHWVFGLGLLSWLAEMARFLFVIQALGVPLALGLVVFVPMANGLLSAIPFTPGGIGIVESGVAGLLVLDESVGLRLALAVALLDRTISLLSIIVTGGAAFAWRQLNNRRAAAERGTA